ncbi:MAG: LUD domain-containing protein [Puniceicoccales bacterium]|nr:LUD domain-containing protein [Puniceicoccales bacterium]
MSTSRDNILSRVNAALKPLETRAAYPEYSDSVALTPALNSDLGLWENFCERVKLVHGTPISGGATALATWLREQKLTHGYCDPALIEQFQDAMDSSITLETSFDRTRVDDYQFGITRATAAIAETGSLVLSDTDTSSRLAALAPWVHIAVLNRAQIYPSVAAAIANLPDDPNIIWCTGPSRTADVEGILIEGVHGPGVQVALLMD